MEARLRCSLFPGQFPSELAVVVRSSTGREFSLFAPKSHLEYDAEPSSNQPVEGWVKVEVLERGGNLCLVRLPRTTLENGPYVTVTADQLDRPAEPQAEARK